MEIKVSSPEEVPPRMYNGLKWLTNIVVQFLKSKLGNKPWKEIFSFHN
jgi:hypothetical protein